MPVDKLDDARTDRDEIRKVMSVTKYKVNNAWSKSNALKVSETVKENERESRNNNGFWRQRKRFPSVTENETALKS